MRKRGGLVDPRVVARDDLLELQNIPPSPTKFIHAVASFSLTPSGPAAR